MCATRFHSHAPRGTRGIETDVRGDRTAQDRPDAIRVFDQRCSRRRLFGGALFAESGDHFLLLNSRCRVAALTKILLFGAIAHHPGMSNLCLLLGAFRRRGFSHHAKCSMRGMLPCNPRDLALPQRRRQSRPVWGLSGHPQTSSMGRNDPTQTLCLWNAGWNQTSPYNLNHRNAVRSPPLGSIYIVLPAGTH
jgi:hypothetical protein